MPEIIRAKFLETYLGKHDENQAKEFAKYSRMIAEIIQEPKKPKEALKIGHKLNQYTGAFSNDLYGEFKVALKDEQLILEAGPDHLQGKLTPWSNDTFILHWPAVNSGHEMITFTFGPKGNAIDIQTESLGTFSQMKDD